MLSDKSIKQLESHRKSFQESLEHLQLKSTSQPTIPQAVESESSTQMDDKSEYPIPSIQLYSTPLIPSITIIPPTPPKKNRQRRFLKRTKFRKKQRKDLSGTFSNNLTTNFSSLPIEGTFVQPQRK